MHYFFNFGKLDTKYITLLRKFFRIWWAIMSNLLFKKKVFESVFIQECGMMWKTCLDMLENPDMPYTTCQNISTHGMLTTVDQVFENS